MLRKFNQSFILPCRGRTGVRAMTTTPVGNLDKIHNLRAETVNVRKNGMDWVGLIAKKWED